MVKRLFDVVLAGLALAGAAPVLALAAVGIRLASPGPVFYRGLRVGLHGRLFRMYKLRTMHVDNGGPKSAITAKDDPRVFPLGRWLRRSKIDELPQLLNVLRGEMSIIGPRPEDPRFVDAHYSRVHFETLDVRPGLASPGSIYNYTHGEVLLTGADPERRYVEQLLPLKLALDVAYVRRASVWYDAALIARTAWVVAGNVLGRRRFTDPPEMADALRLLAPPPARASSLPDRLARALEARNVRYCQWKGHWKRDRWSTGEGDVDLLVDRAAASRVAAVLGSLGLKAAAGLAGRDLPGATMYYGLDCALARPLKVHVHYQLVVGDPWRTHYHLPLERAFLASAVRGDPLALPAPELEYLVFVLRAALRHRWRDGRPGGGAWRGAMQPELAYLAGRADPNGALRALADHLPAVTPALFAACRHSLRPTASLAARLVTAARLRWALRAFAARPGLATRARLALAHLGARVRLRPSRGRRRLAAGGRVISLVGGDGSGKSTCTRELRDWLARDLAVMTAHLGRPPRSLLTLVVGAALKIRNRILGAAPDPDETPARFPGYVALLRLVCTARDRARLYARVQRFATAGGLAICERHPIRQNAPLVGPVVDRFVGLAPYRPLAARLATVERSYYERILPPDVLLVLRLEPDEAVRRKPDEPLEYVRRRAGVIWRTDWTGTGAVVVDAARPLPTVLADLKRAIWAAV